MDKGRKEIHKNANNFVRVGNFSALVVIVVLILRIGEYPPRFAGSTSQSLSQPWPLPWLESAPGSAWMLSPLGLGPVWLF